MNEDELWELSKDMDKWAKDFAKISKRWWQKYEMS